jgi:hypothetical protein
VRIHCRGNVFPLRCLEMGCITPLFISLSCRHCIETSVHTTICLPFSFFLSSWKFGSIIVVILRFNSGAELSQSVELRDGQSGFDSQQGQGIYVYSALSSPTLGPTNTPIQWVPTGSFPGGKAARGLKLTIYLHLVPTSKDFCNVDTK